jgi:hypothetical protein
MLLPIMLLLLVLVALVCDILIHSHPVHAESSPTVYIDKVAHHFGKHNELTIKGTPRVRYTPIFPYP